MNRSETEQVISELGILRVKLVLIQEQLSISQIDEWGNINPLHNDLLNAERSLESAQDRLYAHYGKLLHGDNQNE